MNVSVIGLGKLGSVLAAVLANEGHTVIGVDRSTSVVDRINAGYPPVEETGLNELMESIPARRLRATTNYDSAIPFSDMSLVVVPTPSGPDGTFSNQYVLDAVDHIAANVGDRWHTIVICSTVMPGSCGGMIRDTIEASSGKTVGRDIGLCYSPEFIALGSVIEDMRHPNVTLIGSSDERAAKDLIDLTMTYTCGGKIHVMSLVEAELAKISVNSYVTMKISFANMIGAICEKLPGADAARVLGAVGDDPRIGGRYLKAGATFGGPCFPRDNHAFAVHAEALNVNASLARATDEINHDLADHVTELLACGNKGETIAILGLSYKPGTGVSEESMGTWVAEHLASSGIPVRVHDPMARPTLPAGVTQHATVEETLDGAVGVLVATDWPEYRDIHFDGRVLLDAWGSTLPQANRRVIGAHCWWWK